MYASGQNDFVYVYTDIPEGRTMGEWRTERAAERMAMRAAAREDRRRRRPRNLRLLVDALHVPAPRHRLRGREAHG